MPNWISDRGIWHPMKEKVALKKKDGEPYIYEGPDRAALYELWRDKVEVLGQDFKHDPDLVARIRSLGFKDIEEYLHSIGYDEEKAKKDFEARAVKINKHELPDRIQAIEQMGGGIDTSGQGNDIPGGFGKPKDL